MSLNTRIGEKEIICVICPNSCRMQVWKDSETKEIIVKNNKCVRGIDYGIQEFTDPKRMLITTMRIENGTLPIIPVHSVGEISKKLMFDAITIVNDTYCSAPIKMDDVIIEDILGTGISVVASRDMNKVSEDKVEESLVDKQIKQILTETFLKDKDQLDSADLELVEDVKNRIKNLVNKN